MYLLFYVLTIIHRSALVFLLFAFASAPFFVGSSIFTIYVVLPSIFILLSISTIYIENTLNRYHKQLIAEKKPKITNKCLIQYGICCLHH
jgi:hypothetical protein